MNILEEATLIMEKEAKRLWGESFTLKVSDDVRTLKIKIEDGTEKTIIISKNE